MKRYERGTKQEEKGISEWWERFRNSFKKTLKNIRAKKYDYSKGTLWGFGPWALLLFKSNWIDYNLTLEQQLTSSYKYPASSLTMFRPNEQAGRTNDVGPHTEKDHGLLCPVVQGQWLVLWWTRKSMTMIFTDNGPHSRTQLRRI